MATFLNDFIKAFNKITRLYGEILEVCKKKQTYIVENDIDGLESLLQKESKLLDTVIHTEKERLTVQQTLTEVCKIKDRKININDVMTLLDEPQRAHLGTTYSRVSKIISELREVNEVNKSLTTYSLDLTNKTIELFCTGSFNNGTYQQSGKLRNSDISRVVLDTAV